MEFIPKNKYFQTNENTLEEVRRDVNLHRPGEMKEAVRILQEWIQQQPHFKKKDFLLHYLEMLIVSSKGSIERAKRAIDSMCTTRTLVSAKFEPFHPTKDLLQIWDTNYFTMLPKLDKGNGRINIVKINGKFNRTKGLDSLCRYAYSIFEYLLSHDYHSTVVVIYDLSQLDTSDSILNINLIELKNCFQILLDCYSTRLHRFHIVSDSKAVDKFIAFFRPFIKKKIMDRVVVSKGIEELHKYYPKEILPEDYGGDEKSLSDLHDECIDILSSEEHLEHMKSMMEAQVDESKRSVAEFNELYAGAVGTFRTFTVD